MQVWLLATVFGAGAAAGTTYDDARVRAAGCYVATAEGVLVMVGRLRDKLQLPGGRREPGEPVPCTARRETLEETGVRVRVGEPLAVRNRGRFVLFRCSPVASLPPPGGLQPWNLLEVREVLVLDPLSLLDRRGRRRDAAWRFPEDRALLQRLFARDPVPLPAVTGDACRLPATTPDQRGR